MRLGPCEFQILLCKAIMLRADQYCNWREIKRKSRRERAFCARGWGAYIFLAIFRVIHVLYLALLMRTPCCLGAWLLYREFAAVSSHITQSVDLIQL